MKRPTSNGDVFANKWFERINYEDFWAEVPIVSKARGKTYRVELPVFEAMSTMATKIREDYPTLFKTTVEVHRAAHYFGMMAIRQGFMLESRGQIPENVITNLAIAQENDRLQLCILSQLREGWEMLGEKYHAGLISEETLIREVIRRTEIVGTTDEIKAIVRNLAEDYIANEIMTPEAARRLKNKLAKRGTRTIKKALDAET
jgi:hypothetical protein